MSPSPESIAFGGCFFVFIIQNQMYHKCLFLVPDDTYKMKNM